MHSWTVPLACKSSNFEQVQPRCNRIQLVGVTNTQLSFLVAEELPFPKSVTYYSEMSVIAAIPIKQLLHQDAHFLLVTNKIVYALFSGGEKTLTLVCGISGFLFGAGVDIHLTACCRTFNAARAALLITNAIFASCRKLQQCHSKLWLGGVAAVD